jgi:two-component system, LytTR family, sensor kinase
MKRKFFINSFLIILLITLLFKLLFIEFIHYLDFDLAFLFLGVSMLFYGNIYINNRLNSLFIWTENPKKRIIVQGLSFFFFTSFIVISFVYIKEIFDPNPVNKRFTEILVDVIPLAIIFTLTFLTILIGSQFFKALKESLVEVEHYKTQSANAQIQNLKNQLKPHFLFNNLSVLNSLINSNPDKASEFVNGLSKVYRYIIETKNAELVTLEDEIGFLDHYLYLLKIRFDKGFEIDLNIEDQQKSYLLPPMCLQLLVENTIQHNQTSQSSPLIVKIYSENNTLVITNNIQLRNDDVESSNSGLSNIQSRYKFYTNEKVEISNKNEIFKVILPLISKNESNHY